MLEFGLIANGELVHAGIFTEAPQGDWRPFKPSAPPEYDPETEECVEVAPLIEDDGITRRWEVLPLATPRPGSTATIPLPGALPVPEMSGGVPARVSRRQFRGALRRAGLFEAVYGLRDAPGLDDITRGDLIDFLDAATHIERNHPMIAAFAPMLGPNGVSEQQIDDVFRLAASL